MVRALQACRNHSAPVTMQDAGYEFLILTVDVPKVAPRMRDLKNGFNIPIQVGLKQFFDFAFHPRWVFLCHYVFAQLLDQAVQLARKLNPPVGFALRSIRISRKEKK